MEIENLSRFPAALFHMVPREHIESFIEQELHITSCEDVLSFIESACLKLAEKYSQHIKEILNFDVIFAARNEIERSNLNIEESALSLLWMQFYRRIQEKLQIKRKDTYFRIPLHEYEDIVKELGFELVFALPIQSKDGKEEAFKIWYHPLGVILKYDTYNNQTVVNGGSFYYNWKPNNFSEYSRYTSSGGLYDIKNRPNITDVPVEDLFWVGDTDCRESLRSNFEGLKNSGTFLNPWIKCPFLWFLHFMDTKDKDYDYNKINRERIKLLPEALQKLIGNYE